MFHFLLKAPLGDSQNLFFYNGKEFFKYLCCQRFVLKVGETSQLTQTFERKATKKWITGDV